MVGVVRIIIKINSFFFQKPPGYETVSARHRLRIRDRKRPRISVHSVTPPYYRVSLKNTFVKLIDNITNQHRSAIPSARKLQC